jgi:hypothetical protein
MDKFATLPEEERRNVLQETANRRDLAEIIIEKDFWVCWTLKRLFANPALSPYLTFKGGTSLSKAYGLIERFSEDIDLTISRVAPYLREGKDPMEEGIGSKERSRRIDALKANAQKFVEHVILPVLASDIEAALGRSDAWNVVLDNEDPDRQTLLFHYPRIFNYGGGYGSGLFGVGRYGEGEIGYIKPQIKLEFGARGETEPKETRSVGPYAAETFPGQFEVSTWSISTLSAERTFWEKVTILHSLYHGSKLRDRMSRHYYDTYMLSQRGIAANALQNPLLLDQVVRNKSLLFRDASASYDTAKIGSLKLIPSEGQLSILERDYGKMTEMFMGEYPDFEMVMAGLAQLEARINNL